MRVRSWVILGALLTAAVLLVYWPVVHHQFINYDDRPTSRTIQHCFVA